MCDRTDRNCTILGIDYTADDIYIYINRYYILYNTRDRNDIANDEKTTAKITSTSNHKIIDFSP